MVWEDIPGCYRNYWITNGSGNEAHSFRLVLLRRSKTDTRARSRPTERALGSSTRPAILPGLLVKIQVFLYKLDRHLICLNDYAFFSFATSFFFPSVMTGPTFTYASYDAYTSRSLFRSKNSEESGFSMPPGRSKKSGKRFAIGAFYLAIYALYGHQYGLERILEGTIDHKGFLNRYK